MTVLHVSANAYWNKKNARNATPVDPYVCGAPCRKKYWCPIQPLPEPNMNAKPNAQNSSAHRHVSAMHEIMTFDTSRVLANPASKNMNPACMKNTRNAVTSVHVGVQRVDDVVGLECRRRLTEHRGARFGAEVPRDRPYAQHHEADADHLPAEIGTEISAKNRDLVPAFSVL